MAVPQGIHRPPTDKVDVLLVISVPDATALSTDEDHWLPPDNFALLLLLNGLGAFAMGPTSALVWAMYADVADYGEWKFKRRSTGLVYSASLFSLKTGTMLAGWLLPLFLDRFGFVRNVAQTPQALLGIQLSFSLMPGVFATLKGVALWVYPLTRSEVLRIEAELSARRERSQREPEELPAAAPIEA